jgi:hypothetical protein
MKFNNAHNNTQRSSLSRRHGLANRPLDCGSNRDEWNLGMDVNISTVAREPALMSMQMEVPSSLENSQ